MEPCPPTVKHAQHLRHFKVVAVFDRTKKQSETDKKELLISKQVIECLKAIAPGQLRTFEYDLVNHKNSNSDISREKLKLISMFSEKMALYK